MTTTKLMTEISKADYQAFLSLRLDFLKIYNTYITLNRKFDNDEELLEDFAKFVEQMAQGDWNVKVNLSWKTDSDIHGNFGILYLDSTIYSKEGNYSITCFIPALRDNEDTLYVVGLEPHFDIHKHEGDLNLSRAMKGMDNLTDEMIKTILDVKPVECWFSVLGSRIGFLKSEFNQTCA